MARSRGWVVGLASVLGSFVVYGAHVACGPGAALGVVASAPAQTASALPSTTASATPSASSGAGAEGCGCAAPKVTASFVVSGDEKMVLDPADSTAEVEVTYARGTGGKKVVVLNAVVRAFRTDLAAERPTTFALRVSLPEGGAQPASSKDLEGYVTTWGGTGPQLAPRAYATVTKSALTYSISAEAVEIRGSLTLKDVPTGRSVTLDKLTLRKAGAGVLPSRAGAFHAP
jgi:hypothetical protein